jgi:NADPH:quinone reductase-like Zn-dependent oxidoreductase
MKAIVQKAPGGPHTLEVGEVEMPVPKENQFLIKIAYTTVNRADTMQVTYHLSKVIEDRKLLPKLQTSANHQGD